MLAQLLLTMPRFALLILVHLEFPSALISEAIKNPTRRRNVQAEGIQIYLLHKIQRTLKHLGCAGCQGNRKKFNVCASTVKGGVNVAIGK